MPRPLHWHPVLLAIYPALHLLAVNIASVRPRAAFLSLALSAAAGVVLWLISGLVLRSRSKGALLATLATALFFAQIHLVKMLGADPLATWGSAVGTCLILAAAGFLLSRWHGSPRPWNRVLDGIALVLIVMALAPIVQSELSPANNLPTEDRRTDFQAPLGYLPDIYIIILDAFGRADQLDQIYGVDLSGLQDYLTGHDFEIAERARANYCQTLLSLTTLLNSEYVSKLLPGFGPGYTNVYALNRLVRENRNVRRLRDFGYQLITLTGGSELSVQKNPDVSYRGGALNEFQSTFLSLTPLPAWAALDKGGRAASLDPFTQHRQSVFYQLEKLPFVRAEAGPKLVFAHILSPHPPFVIGPGGESLTPPYEFTLRERAAWDGYVQGYAGQATWVAGELKKTVAGILAASQRPPVILIMGDHGPASRWLAHWRRTGSFTTNDPLVTAERLSIFLALLMPPGAGGEVYPELSPVNVFPLIFERCFGETARLAEDRCFFSTYEEWSTLWDVDRTPGEPPAGP